MIDKSKYFTVFSGVGIPKGKQLENHIGMDTLRDRDGLHFWIGKKTFRGEGNDEEEIFSSLSVYLTREDAKNLITEIKERLF